MIRSVLNSNFPQDIRLQFKWCKKYICVSMLRFWIEADSTMTYQFWLSIDHPRISVQKLKHWFCFSCWSPRDIVTQESASICMIIIVILLFIKLVTMFLFCPRVYAPVGIRGLHQGPLSFLLTINLYSTFPNIDVFWTCWC